MDLITVTLIFVFIMDNRPTLRPGASARAFRRARAALAPVAVRPGRSATACPLGAGGGRLPSGAEPGPRCANLCEPTAAEAAAGPGRLAQRESASFTPRRSLVRSQYRPPRPGTCVATPDARCEPLARRTSTWCLWYPQAADISCVASQHL